MFLLFLVVFVVHSTIVKGEQIQKIKYINQRKKDYSLYVMTALPINDSQDPQPRALTYLGNVGSKQFFVADALVTKMKQKQKKFYLNYSFAIQIRSRGMQLTLHVGNQDCHSSKSIAKQN